MLLAHLSPTSTLCFFFFWNLQIVKQIYIYLPPCTHVYTCTLTYSLTCFAFSLCRLCTQQNSSANLTYRGKKVAHGLWNTAGTDEYDQLRPLPYPDTHIFIIVFAVNSPESLENVEKKWVPEIRANSDSCPFIVVGNKSDLCNGKLMCE